MKEKFLKITGYWHKPKECYHCKSNAVMKKIMEQIEELGEYGAGIFDDPIVEVYNAADDAHIPPEYLKEYCYCEDNHD